MISLNAKEKMLLEDQKSHEQLCVEKYMSYCNSANAQELKDLFHELSLKVQQHLSAINQLSSGILPNSYQEQNTGEIKEPSIGEMVIGDVDVNLQRIKPSTINQHDKMLCKDAISTEKFVSSTYNSAIFEFVDKNIRQVLNTIQREKQENGEEIYSYMQKHGISN